MHKRNPLEVAQVVKRMKTSMRDFPAGGVVAGVVNIHAGVNKADIMVGTVDFTPVHYALLAHASLERAIERMVAMTEPPLDLIKSCHHAMECLDLEELTAQ